MDVRSGLIVDDIGRVPEEFRGLYTQVPAHLSKSVKKLLAAREHAMSDISDNSDLSQWARSVRAYQAEKPDGKAAQRRLRQMAKANK